MDEPLLVLFDGHALVHRAFHALPSLSASKTGEPTGAVYGFVLQLLKVLQDLRPTHLAMAFDRPAPTFRHLEFEEYKAQRPKAPDELVRQLGRVRDVVRAFNIPVFELDGFEADDIIGTISRQAAAQGINTIIVTGDNDELQLVSEKAKVLLPQTGIRRFYPVRSEIGAGEVRRQPGADPRPEGAAGRSRPTTSPGCPALDRRRPRG